VRGIELG